MSRLPIRTLLAAATFGALVAGCSTPGNDAASLDTAAAPTADIQTASNTGTPSEAELRTFMDEVFNKGNLAHADQMMAPDYKEGNPSPGQEPGIEGFKKWVTQFRASFPDLKTEVSQVIIDDDWAAVHIRQTGTHKGSIMGEKPTGNLVDVRGVDLVRFVDGKAVEHWGYYEEAKLLEQLGMMPAKE